MELLADQARVHWSVQSGAIVLRAEERYMVDIPAVQAMPEAVQGMLSSAGAKDVQFDAALLHGSAVRRQIASRCRRSCDARICRPSQLQHSIESASRDGDLRGPAIIGARP